MPERAPRLGAWRVPGILGLLGILLATALLISFSLGRYPIPLRALIARLGGVPFASPRMEAVFFSVRAPRIILSCLVGTSLAAAGVSYQGVFQNPLAAPDILGASSGAATGASLAILLRLPGYCVPLFAFCGSLSTIALVLIIGNRTQGKRTVGLILAGLMVSSLHSAANAFIKLVADPNKVLPEIVYWLMGSLAKTKPQDLGLVLIPMTLGLIPLFIFRWRINLLTLSEEEAQSMGVPVRTLRTVVILCSTLVTASAVSVSGIIGWAGLVIPHVARRLVGNNYQALMPVSMLFGALFLLTMDNVSRNLFATEIPLGLLTSLVGGPFFLWLITRKRAPW
ncbi:MAG: iron ABC transporter permease [Spirochaetaceae bacterium]|jgi:iron complex transport system permease protein|nr:iron ABC transporter permease [Spirochaetaceae bacterium]